MALTSGSHVPATDTLKVDLQHVVYALSDALDLVGVDDVAHGKRVGVMAAACGEAIGLGKHETEFLFDLGMLHDIGVSSTRTHQNLVAEFDWVGSMEHCEVGYALLHSFEPLARMALPIRLHHTRWDALVGQGVDTDVALHANLIHLVDRVDALIAQYAAEGAVLLRAAPVRKQIEAHAGTHFSPLLVEAFMRASAAEAFWLQLDRRCIQAQLMERLEVRESRRTSIHELKHLANIFARIVDAKSHFTAEHSIGVAALGRWLAERMGLNEANCEKIEIAGLLHDVGKLRVPDEILDKPAPLDDRERQIIRTHSFETYVILHAIRGFEEIAQWAAYHHEEPDGTGYPFRLQGSQLPLEARILRVADIFQALAQDRPYRQGLDAQVILANLQDLVARRLVDPQVVTIVASDLDGAMAAARPSKRH